MTKVCSYCEEEKPATAEFFGKRKQSKDGLEYGCRACRKLRWKARKEGKTWISAKTVKFEAEKAEGFRTCVKCDEKKDFSEFERTDGSTRSVCKSCHAEAQRVQRIGNKADNLEYHSIRENLNGARKRAKDGGYDFDITIEDLQPFATHCPIFGSELIYGSKDRNNGATLDKVIPSKGYTKGNVVIISARANRLKADNTVETLKMILDYLT